MVTIDDFKYILTFWKEYKIPNIIERDIHIDLEIEKIIAIAGSRRSGKTYLMFQCMNEFLKKGVKDDNIIYSNFENERLVGVVASDLDKLLIAHKELFNPDGTIYLFLDEIQVVENWYKWIRKIYDTEKYRIIVSGSSSELLSSEIATSLAGRNLTNQPTRKKATEFMIWMNFWNTNIYIIYFNNNNNKRNNRST